MRSMWWQLGILGTISAFAFRHSYCGSSSERDRFAFFSHTGRFIMYSGIKKMYCRKTVGHVLAH